jgi:D-alanyl-D-alanine dipeptidase
VGCALGLLLAGAVQAASPRMVDAPSTDPQVIADCGAYVARPAVQRSLQLVRARLHAQGLQLVLQGCPFVRTGMGQMQQVLDVRVRVIDSDVAAAFVRGPLADGEEVDMGDVRLSLPAFAHGVQAQEVQEDVSPDVSDNRKWLAQLMKTQGWSSVAEHWWAFVPNAKH